MADTTPSTRIFPNILITGTPGTGKTTTTLAFLDALPPSSPYSPIHVGSVVSSLGPSAGVRDPSLDTLVITDEGEDRLLDEIEETLRDVERGYVIDHHSCGIFPERWVDLVVVLRGGTEVVFDRLTERGYGEGKIAENVECEIMGVCLEEARESFEEGVVVELDGGGGEEGLEANVGRLVEWVKRWREDRGKN